MSECQPSKKCGELIVFSWPENHVPMVRHQTVGQQSNGKAVHCCDHDPFKCEIIFQLGKQFGSSVRPVQGMINQFTRRYARPTRHGGTLQQSHQFRQEKGSRPLFLRAPFSFPPTTSSIAPMNFIRKPASAVSW